MAYIMFQKIRGYRPVRDVEKTTPIFPNAFHWIDAEATVEVRITPL